jgi:uncharacterized membrane protein YkgB
LLLHDRLLAWFSRYGIPVLRISFGILFLWLGLLKVVPGVSPAEPLMRASMPAFLPIDAFIRFAAIWEVIIGLGFLSGRFPRITLAMTFCTMVVTLSILWMAPGVVWKQFPFLLSFEGHYVVKDIVIAFSALVLAATLRGRQLVTKRQATQSVVMSPVRTGLLGLYDHLEARVVRWMANYSPMLLRAGFAIVFLWFGLLHFDPVNNPVTGWFQAISPGETLVNQMRFLGILDFVIGISVLTNRLRTLSYILAIVYMIGTIIFSLLYPNVTFQSFPFVLTLEGQTIVKNLVFLGAAIVLAVTSQGGGLSRNSS